MGYKWQEHDGLVTVLIDGHYPLPFMYIDTNGAPPYRLEPVNAETIELETLDAAKMALLMNLKGVTK